jgi:hypothetical protein
MVVVEVVVVVVVGVVSGTDVVAGTVVAGTSVVVVIDVETVPTTEGVDVVVDSGEPNAMRRSGTVSAPRTEVAASMDWLALASAPSTVADKSANRTDTAATERNAGVSPDA